MHTIQEELKDLEQEVLDAQRAYDDDQYTLIYTAKHLSQDVINLDGAKERLAEFKRVNDLQ